jgi:hypothetical protein
MVQNSLNSLLTVWSMELNVPSFQAFPISGKSLLDMNLICPDKIRTKMFMSTGDVIITG